MSPAPRATSRTSTCCRTPGLNVYDILRADKLVLTQDAVNAIHERFNGATGEAKAAPKKRAAKKTEAEGAAA